MEAPLAVTGGSLGFEDFYTSERAELFGAIVMVTRSTGEAEELVQDAFVRVWERWDQVSNHPNPRGYLYRTAFNLDSSGAAGCGAQQHGSPRPQLSLIHLNALTSLRPLAPPSACCLVISERQWFWWTYWVSIPTKRLA